MAGRKRKSEEKVEEVMPGKRVEMEVLPEKRVETESLSETKTKTEDQTIELSKEYNKSSPVSETTGIPELPKRMKSKRLGTVLPSVMSSIRSYRSRTRMWSVCHLVSGVFVASLSILVPSIERSPDGVCCFLSILSFRAVARIGRGRCGMQWWLSTN